MLHEALVEAAMLDAALLATDVTILDVDLRGLREARQLLVGRLGRDDAGGLGWKIGQPHGEAAGIERMEFHEAGPGLVEQDVFAAMADAFQDHLGAVDRAVIGALLNHGDAERTLLAPGVAVPDQRMVADGLAQGLLVEHVPAHRADQAPGIADGRDVDGDATTDHQSAVMGGLVVVAVEQHEVTVGDEGAERDLVRRRGAVEHEIGLFGAEDLGRFLLRLQRRAFMGEEVTEIEHGIVEVVTEHGFAEMLDEHASDRAAVVEHAAVMAWTGPELVAFLGIVDQRAEERGLQRLGILLETADQVLGNEGRRLLGQKDIAVDEIEHLDRQILEPLATDQEDDGKVEAPAAHQIDQRRGLALEALLAPVHHHAADRRIGLHRHLGILQLAGPDHLESGALDLLDDLVEANAFEVVAIEHGCGEQEVRAGPGCLDSAPLDLSGFLPGYAERGALRFCRCVGRA
ncbi:hypothetical protein ACVIHA_002278 [Bradyrhizobium liaoningense]